MTCGDDTPTKVYAAKSQACRSSFVRLPSTMAHVGLCPPSGLLVRRRKLLYSSAPDGHYRSTVGLSGTCHADGQDPAHRGVRPVFKWKNSARCSLLRATDTIRIVPSFRLRILLSSTSTRRNLHLRISLARFTARSRYRTSPRTSRLRSSSRITCARQLLSSWAGAFSGKRPRATR